MSKKETTLKPHYAPLVKPYPPAEVYPHTELHKIDLSWIYKELGLLKNWDASLTRLAAKLANREASDALEIVAEIDELIKKIQGIIDATETALAKLAKAEKIYKNDVEMMLSFINDLSEDLRGFIVSLDEELNEILSCIEERLIIHDKYISDIEDSISNIENALEEIVSENISTKTLVLNSDYTFTFYSGFYLAENPRNTDYLVEEETTLSTKNGIFHSKNLNLTFGGYHRLSNDYVYTSGEDDGVCPIFSHGSDVGTQCYILTLHLNDPYFPNKLNSTKINNCLFNMSPASARATWNIDCGLRYDSTLQDILLNMRTIADGFNQQYYYYIAQGFTDSLSFGSCGIDVNFSYSYFV